MIEKIEELLEPALKKQYGDNYTLTNILHYMNENRLMNYIDMRDYIVRYEFCESIEDGNTQTSTIKDLSIKYDISESSIYFKIHPDKRS